MRTLGYLLLLLVAFVVGMVGTVAASRAVVSAATKPTPTMQQPSGSPARAPIVRPEHERPVTTEC